MIELYDDPNNSQVDWGPLDVYWSPVVLDGSFSWANENVWEIIGIEYENGLYC